VKYIVLCVHVLQIDELHKASLKSGRGDLAQQLELEFLTDKDG